MFNNWLQSLFSSIPDSSICQFSDWIAMDFQGMILSHAIRAAQTGNVNLVSTGAMGFMAGFFGVLLVLIAKGFAVQLAGAGVEGAVQGAQRWGWVLLV